MCSRIEEEDEEILEKNVFYPHWIDDAFLRLPGDVSGLQEPVTATEDWLKLYALFGYSIVVSDVDLATSELISRLYLDPQFCSFIGVNRSFIRIAGQRKRNLGSAEFDLATSAIPRFLVQASTYDKRALKRFRPYCKLFESLDKLSPSQFEELIPRSQFDSLTKSTINDTSLKKLRMILTDSEVPKQSWTKMVGSIKAMHDFGVDKTVKPPVRIIDPNYDVITWYDAISKLQNTEGFKGESSRLVDEILVIASRIPSPEMRGKRAQFLALLGPTHKWSYKDYQMWSTVISAWNYAVQKTLVPSGGGSSPILQNSVAVGPLLEPVNTSLVFDSPLNWGSIAGEKRSPIGWLFPVHPRYWSWKDVEEAWFVSRTSLAELQKSAFEYTGHTTEAALDVHLRTLAKSLTKHVNPLKKLLCEHMGFNYLESAFIFFQDHVAKWSDSLVVTRLSATVFKSALQGRIRKQLKQVANHVLE